MTKMLLLISQQVVVYEKQYRELLGELRYVHVLQLVSLSLRSTFARKRQLLGALSLWRHR
ncbi:MAG: hypothetical protein A2161_06680 [Candidatus Schekmanbacteria bacterium RBG_13_48_7]|uniref:Uncharacterized protein n=1 Tax=Candidatus Schekmanbacteria bacterium RBG_13_48_7 TaxID=1817878 RepID=A0A1F7RL14_9BACT|nr:MAG: hypothetical protein A2161_06680 [Candidatus Schekmanbacteria bacterium RBG_13_48_7]